MIATFFAAHPAGNFFFKTSNTAPQPKVYCVHLVDGAAVVRIYDANNGSEKSSIRQLNNAVSISMPVEKLQIALDAALKAGGAIRLHPEPLPVHDDPRFDPGLYTGAW